MRYYSGKLMSSQKEYGFEPFVAPANFDRTAQEVDIYEKFKMLNSVDETASWIFSCTPAIHVVLPAVTNVSYVYAETINGVETISNKIASGTVFTAGSTKRWVCGYYTGSANLAVVLPNGSVWGYVYNVKVNNLSSRQNSYIKYIHFNKSTSLTTLISGAFYNCTSLAGKLTIPKSFTGFYEVYSYIGAGIFAYCSALTSIVFHDNLTNIGSYAFYFCTGLTGVLQLSNSITTIGHNAFDGCSGLTGDLMLPNSLSSIGSSAFNNCTGLNGILTLPNILISLDDSVFSGTRFVDIISNSALFPVADKILYSLETTNEIKAIYSAYNYVGTITFRNDTTIITTGNLYKRVGTLTIPVTVKNVGSWVFYSCPGITLVNCHCQTAPTLGTSTFNMGGTARPLHIPVTNSGYNVEPWTTTSIFSSIIADL